MFIYLDRTGSCPTTPLPLTVSSVPDNENILQFLSLNQNKQMLHVSLKELSLCHQL